MKKCMSGCGGKMSMKKGGKVSAVKKMKTGGITQEIVGMPGYNAKTNTMKKGGSTSFGMLSVKAGVDNNPKPTAADRIVGAKKKMKNGGPAPSAGLSGKQKSTVAKKASAGKDIGKKGKMFDKIAAKAGGGDKGKRIAAAAMWKNIKRG
jgi:hypothetical protein